MAADHLPAGGDAGVRDHHGGNLVDPLREPDPDAATSWDERKRLFELPRSSWEDYDTSLISEGGGVYSREQKAIPISPQARAALGIEDGVEELTPPALMKAILMAPRRPAWAAWAMASMWSDRG